MLQTRTRSGRGIELRAPGPGDVDRIVDACRDAETRTWIGDLLPSGEYTRDHAREFLASTAEGRARGVLLNWAVVFSNSPDMLLAHVSLRSAQGLTDTAAVGYWAHPEAKGTGAVSAAVRAAVRYALAPGDGLGLRRLTLRAAAANTGSLRVAESVGFNRIGVARSSVRSAEGSWVDEVLFDLLPADLAD